MKTIEDIMKELADPFPPDAVSWKPQAVRENRALAIAYIDARDVQDRLDQVVGTNNWQDEYECLADGTVVCRLKIRLGDEWIVKADVGGESEQPDAGDRRKASFSDALKRAAVKFGIGRYLYRLDNQWCDYDPKKKAFAKAPALPAWALPHRISAAQAKEIADILQETDSNETSFLDTLIDGEFGGRPQTVADIPVRLHMKALKLAKFKKAWLAKREAEKAAKTKETPAKAG